MPQRPDRVIRSSELRAQRGKSRTSQRGEMDDLKARLVKAETQAFRNLRGDAASLETLAGLESDLSSLAAQTATILAVQTANTASFSAHKNGTDQTIVGTSAKVTFGTEAFDVGSLFSSSTWTPPAGIVLIFAYLTYLNATTGQLFIARLYKNGSPYIGIRDEVPSSGIGTCSLSICDQSNGTDYYEMYAEHGAGNFDISGLSEATRFNGSML